MGMKMMITIGNANNNNDDDDGEENEDGDERCLRWMKRKMMKRMPMLMIIIGW